MSARRISDRLTPLSENVSYIEIEATDGDERLWPTNATYVVDHEGHVNFMQPVELDSAPAMRWRIGTARAIAIELRLPEGPDYVLKDWPQGYCMFDHHKGPANNPRHDLYLFGSSKGRFRSVNEFIPHAIWLKRDPSKNSSSCLCKYCSKKSQKEISATLPRLTLTSLSPTPSRFKPTRDKGKAPRDHALLNGQDSRVYAAVRKAPKPLPPLPNVTKHTMVVERNSDLRAVYSTTDMNLKRWFRAGELLWCALDPPIQGPEENAVIKFWPGLVDETRLKAESIPRNSVDAQMAHPHGDDEGVVENDGSPFPWTVRQSTVYKMQLLGVSCTYLVPDNRVLPYQAHIPPNELIATMQGFSAERLDFGREKLASFNPCPGTPVNFEDAVAPYALAVQIGSALSGYWGLTDEWDFEYTIPTSNSVITQPAQPSLQSAIAAASLHNVQSHASVSSVSSSDKYYPNTNYYPNVEGPSPDMSQKELQRLSNRILGVPPSDSSTPAPRFTQTRFQGLWWGAERIWTDDFVRLKVPRRGLAPKGAESIYKPSGAGKSVRELWTSSGRDPAELGAGTRGVFMRLGALFVVDVDNSDGTTKKECRASGMLYELADLDWEETDAVEESDLNGLAGPPPSQAPPTTNIPSQSQGLNTRAPSTSSSIPAPKPSQLSPAPNGQSSSPTSMHYLLPDAPEGYRFRPILKEGHEAVISLSLISGRYYSRILSHPLLEATIREAMSTPPESGGLLEYDDLWALEGLSAGFHNSVDPTYYKTNRARMVRDADKAAASQLELFKQERLGQGEDAISQVEDAGIAELTYPMDVDG